MNANRNAMTLFCDDVRVEIGGKLSFIGTYVGGSLVVDKIPVSLPKLFAYVTVSTPIERPFKSLTFKALLGTEAIGSVSIPPDVLARTNEQFQAAAETQDVKRILASSVLAFIPLVLLKAGRLRTVVETEEGEIRAGRLQIQLLPPEQVAAMAALVPWLSHVKPEPAPAGK